MRPTFFATPELFRAWLAANHDREPELWVGFHKKATGLPSITWPQAVDAALCFGWIDGVRKSVDEGSYMIRFSPRQARSTWSAVNVKRAKELAAAELMHPAGLAAFERRADDRSAIYSYEQRHAAALDADQERLLRANAEAWEFFSAQPPSYRKAVIWWVVSAKKPETRDRRLARLIEYSANGQKVPPMA